MISNGQPLGFHYNDGGISNQKFALLGLCLAAVAQGASERREIYLPKILSRDQHDKRSSLHAFDSVFWGDMFAAFCERWGIVVVEAPEVSYPDRIARGGWTYFEQAAVQIGRFHGAAGGIVGSLTADFFRSLVPRVTSRPVFQKICDQVFRAREISTVAQLRIEEDWLNYCRDHLSVVVQGGEQYALDAHAIVRKIKASLPDVGDSLFVVCDERYLPAPKWEITRTTREETGIALVWKSDLISHADHEALSPLDASLLDFEISALAPRFVGNSRSTFSNLLCFERFARRFRSSGDCYIYNNAAPTLGLRTDLGTAADPVAVCAV